MAWKVFVVLFTVDFIVVISDQRFQVSLFVIPSVIFNYFIWQCIKFTYKLSLPFRLKNT